MQRARLKTNSFFNPKEIPQGVVEPFESLATCENLLSPTGQSTKLNKLAMFSRRGMKSSVFGSTNFKSIDFNAPGSFLNPSDDQSKLSLDRRLSSQKSMHTGNKSVTPPTFRIPEENIMTESNEEETHRNVKNAELETQASNKEGAQENQKIQSRSARGVPIDFEKKRSVSVMNRMEAFHSFQAERKDIDEVLKSIEDEIKKEIVVASPVRKTTLPADVQSSAPDKSVIQCLICYDKLPDAVFMPCGHGGKHTRFVYVIR